MEIGRDGGEKIVIAGAPVGREEFIHTGKAAILPTNADGSADAAVHIGDGRGMPAGHLRINVLGDPQPLPLAPFHNLQGGEDEPIAIVF